MISKKTIFAVVRYQQEKEKMQGIYHMGKLGLDKQVVLVCWNFNLLKNKATVNLSVVDTCRFTQLFGGVCD